MAEQRCRNRGFTALELIVVAVVVCLLVSLLLPAVQSAREAARSRQCQNNLRQIGLAFQQYEGNFGVFPAAYYLVHRLGPLSRFCCDGPADDGNVHLYTEMLLPYLDRADLYQRIDFSSPYFSPFEWPDVGKYSAPNQAVMSTPISVFRCPSTARKATVYTTTDSTLGVDITWTSGSMDYSPSAGIWGNTTDDASDEPHPSGWMDGILSDNHRALKTDDVSDGVSNVMLMYELAGRNDLYRVGKLVQTNATIGGGWADFNNAENWITGTKFDGTGGSDSGACLVNCTNESGAGMYSFHNNMVHILMADSSVRNLSQNVQNSLIVKLVSIDGGSLSDF